MTFQPVLPPILLAVLAVAALSMRVLALRNAGSKWRWATTTLAILLLLVAAARPVIEPDEHGASRVANREAPNVFVVLDRSPDMGVPDAPDGRSRMAVARDDVAALIDRYPGARVAVLSFSARPVLEWPLSADTWSLRPLTQAYEPDATSPDALAQANAGAAGNMLRYQLISAVQQYPRAKTLVFYLGAGTPESQLPPREFNLPGGAVDGGAVIGYGASADGAVLQGIAQQIGVPFVPRGGASSLDAVLPPDDAGTPPAIVTTAAADGRMELYWVPAILAAALILVELYQVLREFRRTRLVNAEVHG